MLVTKRRRPFRFAQYACDCKNSEGKGETDAENTQARRASGLTPAISIRHPAAHTAVANSPTMATTTHVSARADTAGETARRGARVGRLSVSS